MKIDRLIGIITTLLQKEVTTAPQLAAKFEVSKRTINRDIETLCMAGIPIVTKQGMNGGISIMDGYKIDKTLLTTKEMQSIMAGLKGLDSISGNGNYKQLMDKLSVSDNEVLHSNDYIMIDLSTWYRKTMTPKIELIQAAIGNLEKITFVYYSAKGETKRKIDPYQLIFKWSSWYVWGYCNDKKEFRLFKLNRVEQLKNTQEQYSKQAMPYPELDTEHIFPKKFNVKVKFDSSQKWRLIEEFGFDSFKEQKDQSLLFQWKYDSKQNLFDWLITYGDKAELIEPEELREEYGKKITNLYDIYHKKG